MHLCCYDDDDDVFSIEFTANEALFDERILRSGERERERERERKRKKETNRRLERERDEWYFTKLHFTKIFNFLKLANPCLLFRLYQTVYKHKMLLTLDRFELISSQLKASVLTIRPPHSLQKIFWIWGRSIGAVVGRIGSLRDFYRERSSITLKCWSGRHLIHKFCSNDPTLITITCL